MSEQVFFHHKLFGNSVFACKKNVVVFFCTNSVKKAWRHLVKRKIGVWGKSYPGGHLIPSYPICVKKRELWAISWEVAVSSQPKTGDPFVLSQGEWGVNACFKLTKHCSQISHHTHTLHFSLSLLSELNVFSYFINPSFLSSPVPSLLPLLHRLSSRQSIQSKQTYCCYMRCMRKSLFSLPQHYLLISTHFFTVNFNLPY